MNGERFKQILIETHEPAKTLLLWTAVACAIVLTWFGVKTAKAISHSAEAQAQNYERGSGELVGAVSDIRKMLQRYDGQIAEALDNGVQASEAARRIANNTEPQLKAIFGNVNGAVAQSSGLVADLRKGTLPLVDTNLSTLNDNQLKLGRTIETTNDGLKTILIELAASSHDVRVVASSADFQALPTELREFIKGLNRAEAKVELVIDDAHASGQNITGITHSFDLTAADAQKKAHSLLFPPPAPWWKRYILGPLREVGGVTYLFLKIANGM